MIFPSYVFLLAFLPVVLALWMSRLPFRLRLGALTVASYVFYGWWDYRFTALMLISTLVDYLCGSRIHAARSEAIRKRWLALSVASNLSLLGFFKYYDFFVASLASGLEGLGVHANLPLLQVILPIGISFYTFQSMSYSLDIHRRDARPAPDLLHFAAYVSLFPQLVAGPIVRYAQMAKQLERLAVEQSADRPTLQGIWYFVAGLAKKLWIADSLAPMADRLFDGSGSVGAADAWIGSLAYTFQLYFDFSGYSDMALGLGLLLGFRFPINFDSPYRARNVSEFWNRWHISLSHFLRDYLFIPLGGSRMGIARTFRNLVITMFLGGLWHGAQWTFVVWGLFHGALLGLHAGFRRVSSVAIGRLWAVGLTFAAVHLGWVLFRAPDFERAFEIYRGLAGWNGLGAGFEATYVSRWLGELPVFFQGQGGIASYATLLGAAVIAFLAPNTHQIGAWRRPAVAAALGLLTTSCLFRLSRETPFLYFQF